MVALNIGQNRGRKQTSHFVEAEGPPRKLATEGGRRNVVRGHRLHEDRAGRRGDERVRIAYEPALPVGQQRGRALEIEFHARARNDDEMCEVEQFAPAMPGGKSKKGVGADDERQRAPGVFLAQRFERRHGIAGAGPFDFARIDLEIGILGHREPKHRKPILGRASTPEEIAFLKEPGSRF